MEKKNKGQKDEIDAAYLKTKQKILKRGKTV